MIGAIGNCSLVPFPEGLSTHCLRTLVPNTIKGSYLGPKTRKYWALGLSGIVVLVTTQEPTMQVTGLPGQSSVSDDMSH